MPLNIRSDEVNRLAERLAARRRVSKTEAVRQALDETLERDETKLSLKERLKPLQDKIASYPKTGLKADKAFYDSLNDE